MVGLPKNIIKKYGVSKKAWAVYRGDKSMARKKRSSSRSHRKGSRGRSSGMGGLMGLLIGAGAYGVARAPVASAGSGLIQKLPFGQYNDEAALFAASYAVRKWAPGSFMKNLGLAGMIVETASVTSGVSVGLIGGSTASSNSLFSGGY